jgi:hypothetical protein
VDIGYFPVSRRCSFTFDEGMIRLVPEMLTQITTLIVSP